MGSRRARKLMIYSDLGTPELVYKRAFYVTKEPLDLCYEKGLISLDQHKCGIRLRWLYTIRYGVPTVASNFPQEFLRSGRTRDPEWVAHQQEIYKFINEELYRCNALDTVMDTCVYNIFASFLLNPLLEKSQQEFTIFTYAMGKLEDLFEISERIH